MLPGYGPQIATADGGVIAQTYDPATYDYTGPAVAFDQNGNATGQMELPTYSWAGNSYALAGRQTLQVQAAVPRVSTTSYWAFYLANESQTPTAGQMCTLTSDYDSSPSDDTTNTITKVFSDAFVNFKWTSSNPNLPTNSADEAYLCTDPNLVTVTYPTGHGGVCKSDI
jgi:hypothetical protein